MPEALRVAFWFCGALAGTCWLLSLATREHSWVDRLWSIAPLVYLGCFFAKAPGEPRLAVMLGLVAAWSVRLTYNFARKGGYRRGGEDYRWAELRKRMSPALFQLFALVFIAAYQNLLLFLMSLPAWVAAAHAPTPLGPLDAVAIVAFVVFLAGETVADQQQWRFQRAKQARADRGEPRPRFLTTGLFRYSRHPNFFCEQGVWWALYLFAVAASGRWLNVGLAGPVLLTLLFQGSTAFTEKIGRSKYPEYADYQRRTSRLVPWWPRGNVTDASPARRARTPAGD